MLYFCNFRVLNKIVKSEHTEKEKEQDIRRDQEIQTLL